MKKNNFKVLLSYAVLIIVVFAVIALVLNKDEPEPVLYSDVIHYFEENAVIEFTVDDSDYLTMEVYVLDSEGKLNYDKDNKITNERQTIGYQLTDVESFRNE